MTAPYGKRSVVLRGHPVQNEDGTANTTIYPGMLVKGVSVNAPHSVAGGAAAVAIALEKNEFGPGIDGTYVGVGVDNYFYASGEVVKVGVFADGQRFVGLVNSGQVLTEDNFLESAGDGTFRVYGSGVILARVLETITVTAARTKVRMEKV